MSQSLSSKRVYVSGTINDAIELYFDRGWTDGLPIVPPTEQKVLEFLGMVNLDPSFVIGVEPVRSKIITVEKVAINAVMAGCKPEYMPVVLAAVDAMVQPEYNLHGSSASTGGSAPLIIINGPIRKRLSLNSGHNLFAGGPEFRANATIGRAIRLILINVLGNHPGILDRSTLGHGGKYSFCIAEDEEGSAWEPLHVERGFEQNSSTVTVGAYLAPLQILHLKNATIEGMLTSVADSMFALGNNNDGLIMVVPAEPMGFVKKAGWSKKQVREFLFSKAQRTAKEWASTNKEEDPDPQNRDSMVPAIPSPDSIFLISGGGTAGNGALIPRWGKGPIAATVTREIDTSQLQQ